jgi:hypothetical protein
MRGVACLLLGHAARDVPRDGAIDVELELLVELTVGDGAPKERTEPNGDTAEHHSSC